MAQQINLLTPILLAPKRYFSALAMLKALSLLSLGLLVMSAYLVYTAAQGRAAYRHIQVEGEAERQQLLAALVQLPQAADPKVLQQQLDDAKLRLERSRQLSDLLSSGQAPPGQRHSDLLSLLAASTPQSVWLSELRWSTGALELDGATLDPNTLRAWLAQIADQPVLRDLHLAMIKVERRQPTAAGLPVAEPRTWTFTVRSELSPAAAPARPDSTRAQP